MNGTVDRGPDSVGANRARGRCVQLAGAESDSGAVSVWTAHWSHLERDLTRYLTYLLAGDTQTAEDVAQETAIRLWQHPEVLTGGESVAGWLRTVARNIVIDRVRRRRARPIEVALTSATDPPHPWAADLTERIDQASSLETILSLLSPHHREAVYQVYLRDRAVADVAADLGIPPGTVKSRCHTAIRHLRAIHTDTARACA